MNYFQLHFLLALDAGYSFRMLLLSLFKYFFLNFIWDFVQRYQSNRIILLRYHPVQQHISICMIGRQSPVPWILDLTKDISDINKRNLFNKGIIKMKPPLFDGFKIFDICRVMTTECTARVYHHTIELIHERPLSHILSSELLILFSDVLFHLGLWNFDHWLGLLF